VLRRFSLPGPAEALAVAPDGRTAAALVGRHVALLDLAPGT
jgi:hypothetical protein